MGENPRDLDTQVVITEIVTAVHQTAEEAAVATATFLKLWCHSVGIKHKGEWPRHFLQELAAILELRRWQRSGHIPVNLQQFPAWDSLVRKVLQQNAESVSQDVGESVSPLQREIMRAWFKSSAWGATAAFGAPFMVSDVDIEALLDQFAAFLWGSRHLASSQGKQGFAAEPSRLHGPHTTED